SGPAGLGVGAITLRGGTFTLNGTLATPGTLALSTTDDTVFTIEAAGNVLFSSTLTHPESDPFWRKSRPPNLFKYKGGGAGGLVSLQLRLRGPGYVVKAKGRDDRLLTVQGGALAAELVVGNQCYAATVPCVKKGRGLRCAG